jgi:hypothetical protein
MLLWEDPSCYFIGEPGKKDKKDQMRSTDHKKVKDLKENSSKTLAFKLESGIVYKK